MRVSFGEASLINFCNKWVSFPSICIKIGFELFLFIVHVSFIFESVLVQDFVLFLSSFKSVLKALIILKLTYDFLFRIICTHSVVFYFNLVHFALFNKS